MSILQLISRKPISPRRLSPFRKSVVCVGFNCSPYQMFDLEGAGNDAVKLADVIKKSELFSVDDPTWVVACSETTSGCSLQGLHKTELYKILKQENQAALDSHRMGRQTSALVLLSGHGQSSSTDFGASTFLILLPNDGTDELEAIPLSTIVDKYSSGSIYHTLLMFSDSCRNINENNRKFLSQVATNAPLTAIVFGVRHGYGTTETTLLSQPRGRLSLALEEVIKKNPFSQLSLKIIVHKLHDEGVPATRSALFGDFEMPDDTVIFDRPYQMFFCSYQIKREKIPSIVSSIDVFKLSMSDSEYEEQKHPIVSSSSNREGFIFDIVVDSSEDYFVLIKLEDGSTISDMLNAF